MWIVLLRQHVFFLFQSSDIRSLQAQVLSLINEVTESQNKCEAATNTIEQRNARYSSSLYKVLTE